MQMVSSVGIEKKLAAKGKLRPWESLTGLGKTVWFKSSMVLERNKGGETSLFMIHKVVS